MALGCAAPAVAQEAPRAWSPRGPAGFVDAVDILADGARVAVVGAGGAVWRSDDGGRTWDPVLGALPGMEGVSQEDVRLDAEVRLQELTEEFSDALSAPDGLLGEDGEDSLQDALDAQDGAFGDVSDVLSDGLQADALDEGFFRASGGADGGVARPRLAWSGDALAVARTDGVWTIGADGVGERVLDRAAYAVAAEGERLVVALAAGLQVRDARRGRWTEIAPKVSYAVDLALRPDGTVLAAAADGLWRVDLSDGGGASRVIAATGMRAVVVEPSGDAWATDGGSLWWLPAGADSAEPRSSPASGPIVDLAVAPAGVLVVASVREVVLASGDVTERLGAGRDVLGTPRAVAAGGPWVASDRGVVLWRDPSADEARSAAAFVPVPVLLDAAVQRPGQVARTGGRSTQFARWLVPSVVVELRSVDRRGLSSRLDAGRYLDTDNDIGGFVRVVWQPPARQAAEIDPEDLIVEVDENGTEVFNGAFDDGVLVSRLARRAVAEQSRVSGRIVELVQQRAQLDAARETATGDGLRARVRLALRIAEIDATLDALTDGAVARWRAAQALGGPG